MDNPVIAEYAQMTSFQNQWLIARGKARPKTKAQMKKAATVDQKLAEKLEKACKMAWSKNQPLNKRRLAISNSNVSEISIFKDILSDPLIGNPYNLVPSQEKRMKPTFSDALVAIRLKNIRKKKAKDQALTKGLNL